MNIVQYWHSKFGFPIPSERSNELEALPLDSPCGNDCKEYIDAFATCRDVHVAVLGEDYTEEAIKPAVDIIHALYFG